jgi:Domain of unknown function (DUF4345)
LFSILVKGAAAICLVVGGWHALAGIGTLPWLGAAPPPAGSWIATLDSQDRFYGGAFMGYGAILLAYLREPGRYRPIFQMVAGAVFLGGMARLIAVVLHGWPPPLVVGLLAIELVAPPLLLFLERQEMSTATKSA